ncbi:alcohol dehydrogenase [Colletotrichum salicis]|uniref:Alcohol dehydrogenase n=1 Tax=Colletotrichum salicis TaxID=1209931 RepID=A0A135TID3_9PEZI|nr:alcohol dehydrogenase [Colletotrichum salicis]
MKRVEITAPGVVSWVDHPTPIVGPKDVLLKIEPAGCIPLGHEPAGEVAEIGKDIESPDVEVGDLVVVDTMVFQDGLLGSGGAQDAQCEYVVIYNYAPRKHQKKIPKSIPWHIAALNEPMAVALHATSSTRGSKRLEKALKVGADAVINSAEAEDLAAKLVELQGDGATAQNRGTRPGTDIFLDAAGAPPVPTQVCNMAKRGATFGVVGVHRKPTELNFAQLISTELTTVFSVGYPNEIFEVTDDIVDNWDKYAEIASDQIPFDQALEALELAKSGKANKVVVVFD